MYFMILLHTFSSILSNTSFTPKSAGRNRYLIRRLSHESLKRAICSFPIAKWGLLLPVFSLGRHDRRHKRTDNRGAFSPCCLASIICHITRQMTHRSSSQSKCIVFAASNETLSDVPIMWMIKCYLHGKVCANMQMHIQYNHIQTNNQCSIMVLYE